MKSPRLVLRDLGKRIVKFHEDLLDSALGETRIEATHRSESITDEKGLSQSSFLPLFPQRTSFFYGESYLLRDSQAIAPSPVFLVPESVFRELVYHFSRMPKEMQVMGFVEKDEHNIFTLTELVIPPHVAGYAHADLDQGVFDAWLDVLEAEGKDIVKLRFQGHSHGEMDAYFSGTDMKTIRDAYTAELVEWMIHLVGNQRGKFLARLDIYKPVQLSIGLPLMIESPKFSHSEGEEAVWQKKLADARRLKRRRR